MKPQVKVPRSPRLPQGLIALVAPRPRTPPSERAEARAVAEPIEATRAWKPNPDLLHTAPQPEVLSHFESAADEPTMVGVIDLNDPSLFRSAPPPAPEDDADLGCGDDAGEVVEFVGVLAALSRDEAQPTGARSEGDEQTKLYRPQRTRLAAEETTDEVEWLETAEEAPALGPAAPKIIIAPAVLAGAGLDPARAEATKKKRRALPGNDSKVGLGICLLGVLALALSVAWRHPRTAPLAHDALTRAGAAATSLLGR